MKFGCVIVNYGAAAMALDAALSFLGAGGRRVVIVDNESTDDSRDVFAAFVHGAGAHRPIFLGTDDFPIPYARVEPAKMKIHDTAEGAVSMGQLDIVYASDNRGFAAGCNIGLRILKSDPSLDAFLLLNPDAVLAAGAMDAFAAQLEKTDVGLCGATVLETGGDCAVQALGGARMEGLFHRGFNIGQGEPGPRDPSGLMARQRSVEAAMTYPLGAAMACRRDYLDTVGFLDERYFLYFEEADWCFAGERAAVGPVLKTGSRSTRRQSGYRLAWAPDAIVFHHYGASSKSERSNAAAPSRRSPLSDFHMARSRLLFARKWRPHTVPVIWLATHAQALIRIGRGQIKNAQALFAAALGRAYPAVSRGMAVTPDPAP